jgi:hypothetical protein
LAEADHQTAAADAVKVEGGDDHMEDVEDIVVIGDEEKET